MSPLPTQSRGIEKEWTPQEGKLAKECDVVYFHETHAVSEWTDRLGGKARECVAACHDEDVARAAKNAGFEYIFFAKKADTDGLTKTVMQAVEFYHSDDYPHKDVKESGFGTVP